jgi:hypothetical protein
MTLHRNRIILILHDHAAENDPHDGKRKCEALWPIFRICHQRSRYIYDLYYRRKEISKELYEFCLNRGYADCNLIAKWKKVCIVGSVLSVVYCSVGCFCSIGYICFFREGGLLIFSTWILL